MSNGDESATTDEALKVGTAGEFQSIINLSSLRYVFQGTIVVPTGNPFDAEARRKEQEETRHQIDGTWLGPGLKMLLDHVLAVNQDGIIVSLAPMEESKDIISAVAAAISISDHENDTKRTVIDYVQLSSWEFLCPGMIDLHIHAPQFAYTGTATDRPLTGPDGWLETYTFPAEARLRDNLDLAKQVYKQVVSTTLQAGTTTAVYFGTLHLQPNQILVDAALELGQRALIGKVCMDRNSPENYCQSLEDNLKETITLVEYIRSHSRNPLDKNRTPLVLPLITPRFIPTCTPELLTELGRLAAQHNCHITSHISESNDEVAWSRQLDKEDHGTERTDAAIFHAHGLLTDKCIMAHGVHLNEKDLDLMIAQGAAIAHCPLSNFFFAGKHLPCDLVMERGNKVGLGTDVAGGYSPSMMNSARTAVLASQAIRIQESSARPPLGYRHTVYLATLGGAEALGLQDRIGTFRVGMEFEAIILSAEPSAAEASSSIPIFPQQDSLSDVFQKLWFLGDDRNVSHVFVQGKQIKNNRRKR